MSRLMVIAKKVQNSAVRSIPKENIVPDKMLQINRIQVNRIQVNRVQVNRVQALISFIKSVYNPGLHMAFAAGWFLALEGLLVLIEGRGESWVIDRKVFLGILSIFLALFYLRVADEIKDYTYDKLYHPDRPLVRGAVTFRDLHVFLAVTGAVVILLNAFLSWLLAIVMGLDMAYALFLIHLEKMSSRVRDRIFLNLLVTYPVNIGISVYIYLFFLTRYKVNPGASGILLLAAFELAFLHYEIGRKTCWPHHAPEGMRLYSNVLGATGSALLAFFCALTACAITLCLAQPGALSYSRALFHGWTLSHGRALSHKMEGAALSVKGTTLPLEGAALSAPIAAAMGWLLLIPAIPAFWGTYRFFRAKTMQEIPNPAPLMTPSAMSFLSLFYLVSIVEVIISRTISFCL